MQRVFDVIRKVADTDLTVLIRGPSGTGKELVASAIHYNSPRRAKPLIKVNCAAFSRELVESELFGHEKGAFTGADRRARGQVRDRRRRHAVPRRDRRHELETQAKLLRVLQEKEFERVGGNRTIKVDVRIIAATNQDLEAMVQSGSFREDLYYRLNVVPIALPPLRERPEDIPLLIDHFLGARPTRLKRRARTLSREAYRALRRARVEGQRPRARARHRAGGRARLGREIGLDDLPSSVRAAAAPAPAAAAAPARAPASRRRAFARPSSWWSSASSASSSSTRCRATAATSRRRPRSWGCIASTCSPSSRSTASTPRQLTASAERQPAAETAASSISRTSGPSMRRTP